jgi:hypothetical protein
VGARIEVKDLEGQVRIADIVRIVRIVLAAPEHPVAVDERRPLGRGFRGAGHVPENLREGLIRAGVRDGVVTARDIRLS